MTARTPLPWVIFPGFFLGSLVTAGDWPDDPDFVAGLQWGLRNVGQVVQEVPGLESSDVDAPGAWAVHRGTLSVVVAIVGRGISPHPEFADRLLEGRATVGDLFDTRDTCPHDTHLAGVIAASADNALGISGLNGRARILPVRVFDGCVGTQAATAEGIIWAVDRGADIVLVPIQFDDATEVLAEAVEYAVDRDVVVIAPAGSAGNNSVTFPAAFDGCMAVSATTNQDVLSPFSNHGPQVDLAAPGRAIWSTWVDGGFAYLGEKRDTAAASAFVAGVAALLRSYAPQLDAAEVRRLLMDSADDLGEPGRDTLYGAGRVNARRALEATPPAALRFEHVEPIPDIVPPDTARSFVVRIVGVSQAVAPETAELLFRESESSDVFSQTPLTPLGDDSFLVELPEMPCDSRFSYFLRATGDGGTTVTDPLRAPQATSAVHATIRQSLFVDDFESDMAWEVVGGDNASGRWDRVVPVGTTAQPGFDFTPDAGAFCYVTGQHFGGSDGTNDVDGGPVILISPEIELPFLEIEVSYARWFRSISGTEDVLTVELSRDGGGLWVVVETVLSSSGWQEHSFRLSEFPQVSGNRLRIRFSSADLGKPSLTEAAIDDFRVTALRCSARRGDANHDGAVDLIDYRIIYDCWTGPGGQPVGSGCAAPDFDASRHIDLNDFREFQMAFAPKK